MAILRPLPCAPLALFATLLVASPAAFGQDTPEDEEYIPDEEDLAPAGSEAEAKAGDAADGDDEEEDDGWDEWDEEEAEGTQTVHAVPDVRDAPAKGEDVQKGFIKGELAAVGRIDLVSRFHRFGLKAGATGFDKQLYARGEPVLDLNYPDLGLHLGFSLPINVQLADFGVAVDKSFKNVGQFRSEDWDEPSDYLQVVRYAAFGGKEQEVFVNLSQLDSVSIAHGTVMRRYVSNLDVNRHRVGGELDAYNDYGGFELHVNDLAGPNVVGALAFVKPGRFISEDRPLKRLSAGAHYTADFDAPVSMVCAGRTVLTCEEELERGYFGEVAETETIQFVGLDVEFKPVRSAAADIKPYLDYTQMIGHGGGATLGMLGRFNLGAKRRSAFRLRLEGRSFDADYIPSYFDILYEVDRNVSLASIDAENKARTKLAYVKSLKGEERRLGLYVEATYVLRGWFALTGAWEQSTAASSKSALLHLELPASKWFTLFFTYVKRNFEQFDDDPFDFRRTGTRKEPGRDISDELFFWAFRVKILPILAFNWRSQKAFEVREDRYQDVFHFIADVELGYEF